jgi:VIT1/CCC1 family predicted Fe2+/Mn2+ transporter
MSEKVTIENYLDSHYIHRSNWLRAAVLGANDGIISVSSLAIGVTAASATREPILLATVAGLVAGALSMAAGEYVSVSSQTDIEQADIKREAEELKEMPEAELQILAQIYEKRGLKKETALQVAKELTAVDALGAHVRDELGITEMSQANPIQAALASGLAFTAGGALPLLVALFAPDRLDGICTIRIYHVVSNRAWCRCGKDRWISHDESNPSYRYLGHHCHGIVRFGGLSFWGECLSHRNCTINFA